MSTNGVPALEVDMRDLLRTKKAGSPEVNKEPNSDYSTLVFQLSGRSIEEINRLIEDLNELRDKLNKDGDRLQREIAQHDAFSQSILQLTNIVAEGMATLNRPAA